MNQVKAFFAFVFSSMFGIFFLLFIVLSLPLNILAVMRLWGWEWWSAFIAVGIYTIIPFLGQLAYVVFTFVGAYYLYDANWNWRSAVDPLPKTFSMATMTPADFDRLKSNTILPQLTRQCMEDAKTRFGIDGKISVSTARFCECFAQVAAETTTQDDLLYQEINKKQSPGYEDRIKASLRAKCSS